jgi:hypothetical protein
MYFDFVTDIFFDLKISNIIEIRIILSIKMKN